MKVKVADVWGLRPEQAGDAKTEYFRDGPRRLLALSVMLTCTKAERSAAQQGQIWAELERMAGVEFKKEKV